MVSKAEKVSLIKVTSFNTRTKAKRAFQAYDPRAKKLKIGRRDIEKYAVISGGALSFMGSIPLSARYSFRDGVRYNSIVSFYSYSAEENEREAERFSRVSGAELLDAPPSLVRIAKRLEDIDGLF